MTGPRFGDKSNFGTGNVSYDNQGQQTQGDRSPMTVGFPDRSRKSGAAAAPESPADRSRNVFVVHGRDEQVRREVFELLRRLDLRPLEWEDLVGATGQASPFIGEVVARAPHFAQAALVLLTPDDEARLHPSLHREEEPEHETRATGQARPNVLIELGMVLMAYPERTLIVEFGTLRPASDIAGRNVIQFDGSETAIGKVVERLKRAGCQVNDTGSDWRQTWPFRHLAAYGRRPGRP